jgi:hypothetical protein
MEFNGLYRIYRNKWVKIFLIDLVRARSLLESTAKKGTEAERDENRKSHIVRLAILVVSISSTLLCSALKL